MYVQVIQSTTSEPEALRAAAERWARDLGPGATGWLGSTAGVTADGRAIALVRWESEEAVRRNDERPEQAAWWAETAELIDVGTTIQESGDVTLDLPGDPDRAGFVQVMQGRTTDPERAKELSTQDSELWAAFRPDILGSIVVGHEDGRYTMAIYFTSEADAREGERRQAPPELQPAMDEMGKLFAEEPEYLDLERPLLLSPIAQST